MIFALLILLPAAAAAIVYLLPSPRWRRRMLPLTGLLHLGLTITAIRQTPLRSAGGWLLLDPLGAYFLTIMSILFLAISWYAWSYFRRQPYHAPNDAHDPFHHPQEHGARSHEAQFGAALLLFLSTMTLVIMSNHLGLFWIAMEATTLASTPLIYYYQGKTALEAMWKYLLICSVGIALALLGNLILQSAAGSLLADELATRHTVINAQWLKLAVVFFLVGYGTKMGLAPMHSWLPDAHSEAPAFVSALLSGALLNCACLGLLRIYRIGLTAGIGDYCSELFRCFGVLSLLFAAFFILGQNDFKRMLAYSSIEHMGLILLGIGLGGEAVYGSLFHVCNHSFTKGMLFLLAGNLLLIYGTRSIHQVTGLLQASAANGILWLLGFLAIVGMPPFGLFYSELLILKSALAQHHYVIAVLMAVLLGMIFAGMAGAFLKMTQGNAPELPHRKRYATWNLLPPAALGVLPLAAGLYLPPSLTTLFKQLAAQLGG